MSKTYKGLKQLGCQIRMTELLTQCSLQSDLSVLSTSKESWFFSRTDATSFSAYWCHLAFHSVASVRFCAGYSGRSVKLRTHINSLGSKRVEVSHNILYVTFGGLGVACWPLVPKIAGSNPAEAVGFLRAKKFSVCLPSEGK